MMEATAPVSNNCRPSATTKVSGALKPSLDRVTSVYVSSSSVGGCLSCCTAAASGRLTPPALGAGQLGIATDGLVCHIIPYMDVSS